MRIDRRRLLGLLGSGLTLPGADALAQGSEAFAHGVASGDPLADRVILWTRLTVPDGRSRSVEWQVAEDAGFSRMVRRGRAAADVARDHTVKIDASGLKPGQEYFYRFKSGAATSATGRVRTLPAGPTADAVLAVCSCQLHPSGLFNAYEALASLPRLDAVVHLGDYIYEYGASPVDYGMAIGKTLGRLPEPPHETISLADYRRRHAQYKSDPDLQAAHARAAFICVWDDHEVTNDGWLHGAQNHQVESEGDWEIRKAAAIRAYFEWMPIREPKGSQVEINRRFDFGDLASLHMVETRLGARVQQLSFADLPMRNSPGGAPVPDVAAFEARRNAPERELLGETQHRWLAAGLKDSVSAGRPWQVIGNQVVMAEVFGPDPETVLDPQGIETMLNGLAPEIRTQVERSMAFFKLGLPYNLDAWDGYPAARTRLYESFKASGARPIVLSGDSHSFWVNQLKTSAGETVAVELGTTSISSPSNGDALPTVPLGEALIARNDQVLFSDQKAKGFVLLTLRPDAALAELHTVSTVLSKPFNHTVLKRFRIPADPGAGHVIEG